MGLFGKQQRKKQLKAESVEGRPTPAPSAREALIVPHQSGSVATPSRRKNEKAPVPKSSTSDLKRHPPTRAEAPSKRKDESTREMPDIPYGLLDDEEERRSEWSHSASSAADSAMHLTNKPSSVLRKPSPSPRRPTPLRGELKKEEPALAALQAEGPDVGDAHLVDPLVEDDPRSWHLVPPPRQEDAGKAYNIEKRAQTLLSRKHMEVVFDDPKLLRNFVSFIQTYRPASVPRLTCYRQAKKALQAIRYSDAVASMLCPIDGHDFTVQNVVKTEAPELEKLKERAFDEIASNDFPAYVCSIWIPLVAATVHQRINGTLPAHLKQASEGLAEVFCLTDPRREDGPIVLASKEFTTTTQYGLNFVCGQNCRFLQGSGTDRRAVQRVRDAVAAQREHSEILLNYRRDGSPFMNLCMLLPLTDFEGNLKYYLGAQVDVSGLLKSCAGFDSLATTVRQEEGQADSDMASDADSRQPEETDFQKLSEMLDDSELTTVRNHGGAMHRIEEAGDVEDDIGGSARSPSYVSDRPRMLLVDANETAWTAKRQGQERGRSERGTRRPMPKKSSDETRTVFNRQMETMYKDFLLVRPAPNFSITYTSSSLKDHDLMQTDFFLHVGGSTRVRDGLKDALIGGHKVTAKVRWLRYAPKRAESSSREDTQQGEGLWIEDTEKKEENSKADEAEGTLKWIHCTPLIGGDGKIGVWVVMLIDDAQSRD